MPAYCIIVQFQKILILLPRTAGGRTKVKDEKKVWSLGISKELGGGECKPKNLPWGREGGRVFSGSTQ